MTQLIPGVGVRGLFSLKAPFDAKLLANTPYQVMAVRRLDDLVAAGLDPRALYYTANSLEDKYAQDLADGVSIVSLAAGGEWVYVPTTYILAMPDQGGVPYTVLALAVSLGAIPNQLDLSYLKTRVAALVQETVGVTPTDVHTVALSNTTNVSQAEHATLTAARQALITENQTDHAKLVAMTAQRDALAAQLQVTQKALADALAAAAP